MNPGLCLILAIFVDSFCSGRPKSRYGGVLAFDFDDFYHQHSFEFHIFRAIILQNSCTLTSSISFGECLNAGTIYPKLSQNGNNSRPVGLSLVEFHHETLQEWSWAQVQSQAKGVSHKKHKLRPKGLNQDKLDPPVVTNQRIKTNTDLRSNVQPSINVLVQRSAERR